MPEEEEEKEKGKERKQKKEKESVIQFPDFSFHVDGGENLKPQGGLGRVNTL